MPCSLLDNAPIILYITFMNIKLCECGCGQATRPAKQSNTALGHIRGVPVRFIQGHHLKRGTLLERFERFFKKTIDSCWVWQGSCNHKGYGQFGISSGNMKPAHRISYGIYKGHIPNGKFVCHSCDNPPCVNPAHLFVGTNRDNMIDMFCKNRGNRPVGERHHQSVLTTNEVLNIRADLRQYKEISMEYGISIATDISLYWRKSALKFKT